MDAARFYLSIAVMPITTIIIVLIGVLLNNNNMNARLDDLSRHFEQRLNDLRDLLRAEIARNHSEMLTKFAELDSRLARLEDRLRLH